MRRSRLGLLLGTSDPPDTLHRMTPAAGTPLTVGAVAPDFSLTDQIGSVVRLSEAWAERPVLLVFFPFAFSGICTGELSEIREDLGAFDNDEVQVFAVSCDPTFSLRAWADKEAYFFPLLSDFWPHGEAARGYGVFHDRGFAIRGTFLIDRGGIVRWSLVNGPGDRRDFSGCRDAVKDLAASNDGA